MMTPSTFYGHGRELSSGSVTVGMLKRSRILLVPSSASFDTMTLPDARSLTLGGPIAIVLNQTSGDLTINANDDSTVCVVPAKTSVTLCLSENSDLAGHWRVVGLSEPEAPPPPEWTVLWTDNFESLSDGNYQLNWGTLNHYSDATDPVIVAYNFDISGHKMTNGGAIAIKAAPTDHVRIKFKVDISSGTSGYGYVGMGDWEDSTDPNPRIFFGGDAFSPIREVFINPGSPDITHQVGNDYNYYDGVNFSGSNAVSSAGSPQSILEVIVEFTPSSGFIFSATGFSGHTATTILPFIGVTGRNGMLTIVNSFNAPMYNVSVEYKT